MATCSVFKESKLKQCANVLRHPTFEKSPVVNIKLRGRKKGVAILADARRRKQVLERIVSPHLQKPTFELRCSIGAIAVLTSPQNKENTGRIVRVIARIPDGDTVMWSVQSIGAPLFIGGELKILAPARDDSMVTLSADEIAIVAQER